MVDQRKRSMIIKTVKFGALLAALGPLSSVAIATAPKNPLDYIKDPDFELTPSTDNYEVIYRGHENSYPLLEYRVLGKTHWIPQRELEPSDGWAQIGKTYQLQNATYRWPIGNQFNPFIMRNVPNPVPENMYWSGYISRVAYPVECFEDGTARFLKTDRSVNPIWWDLDTALGFARSPSNNYWTRYIDLRFKPGNVLLGENELGKFKFAVT